MIFHLQLTHMSDLHRVGPVSDFFTCKSLMGQKEGCQYTLELANPQLIVTGEEILQGKPTISGLLFSQKLHINGTWECESITYLNYMGARAHCRNFPAPLKSRHHTGRWGKYYVHTACCTTCTITIPCDLHLMMEQVLLITGKHLQAWSQTFPPVPQMALLGSLQVKSQGTNVRCWWKSK